MKKLIEIFLLGIIFGIIPSILAGLLFKILGI